MDWLKLVVKNQNKEISNILDVNYHSKKDVLKAGNDTEKAESETSDLEAKKGKSLEDIRILAKMKSDDVEEAEYIQIQELLNWQYPNKGLTQVKGKSSVTEISEKMDSNISNDENEDKEISIAKKPKFLEKTIKLTGAEIGTAVHLILQNVDFKLDYDEQRVEELINSLVQKEILTRNEADSVDLKQILKFTKSEIYARVQKAKKVFKEQPFYINIPAKEIYKNDLEENILVQGIVDLYFVDKDDKIVLVDYKTNYIEDGKEEKLIKKYKEQLSIYKRAIEGSTNKDVKETYIYSTYLGRELS
ncbi:MAG: PD-(D/E)XK nuclease family protein [Oscillospiraceae bacterium]|nr:PD-(D/E)XK nuclease family protein [Oscillospiraceae bacterium]